MLIFRSVEINFRSHSGTKMGLYEVRRLFVCQEWRVQTSLWYPSKLSYLLNKTCNIFIYLLHSHYLIIYWFLYSQDQFIELVGFDDAEEETEKPPKDLELFSMEDQRLESLKQKPSPIPPSAKPQVSLWKNLTLWKCIHILVPYNFIKYYV